MESNKYKSFNGSGKVREFITEVELQSSLKGYTGLKAAQKITSRLDGPAFDVYMNNKKRSQTQLDSRKQVRAFQDRVITIKIKEAQHPLI